MGNSKEDNFKCLDMILVNCSCFFPTKLFWGLNTGACLCLFSSWGLKPLPVTLLHPLCTLLLLSHYTALSPPLARDTVHNGVPPAICQRV